MPAFIEEAKPSMPDPSLPFEGYLSKKILVCCLTYFSTAHLKRCKYTKGENSDSKQCRNIWPKGLQSKPAAGKSTLSFSFITQRKNKQLEAKPLVQGSQNSLLSRDSPNAMTLTLQCNLFQQLPKPASFCPSPCNRQAASP